MRAAARGGARRPHLRGAAGRASRCARPASSGPPSTGSTPGRVVDAVRGERRRARACCRRRRSATSTTSTAASSTRSRSAGPCSSARRGSSCSRSAGSTGRSSRRRSGRGRSPGCPSRSPAGTGSSRELAELPDGVECHVLPGPRHVRAATTRSGPARDFGRVAAPDRRDLRRQRRLPGRTAPRDAACVRRVVRGARSSSAGRAALGHPAAVADRAPPRSRRCCPGRLAGAAAAVGLHALPDVEALLLLVLLGLLARQRLRLADPAAVLGGHPLRPGAGRDVGVLPRGQAGAQADHRDRRPDARRPSRACRSWWAAGTPGRATRSR